jgi:hypothetical protein
MFTETIAGNIIERYGIGVGRRVKDEDGKLWVVEKVNYHTQADTADVDLVPWTPVWKPPHVEVPRPGRVTTFVRG